MSERSELERRGEHLDDGVDAAPLDLTPRSAGRAAGTGGGKRRHNLGVGVVLAVLLAAAAFVVFKGLSQASVYFCNADEVGVRDACRGSARFRLQGTVDAGSVRRDDGRITEFTVSYGGATVPVRYQGAEPTDMFQEGIPVVVEGRLAHADDPTDTTFAGDRILVKHSEQYRAENPDRVPEGAP